MSEPLAQIVARALAEDVGDGDITAEATVPAAAAARALLVQKQAGVVYGLAVVDEVFAQAGAGAGGVERLEPEGVWREDVPAVIAVVEGPARALLAGERTALNFLGRLSGIATLTHRFVDAVRDTPAAILDTRKTTPGMRELEKAAVHAGGGRNHRRGLHDAILIKENHAAFAGGVGAATELARAAHPEREIEVECRDLDEVTEAIAAGARRLLLDNMSLEQLRRAVAIRDAAGGGVTLEASGGITLASVAEVAATGVELISVGALTHSAPTLDLSLLITPA